MINFLTVLVSDLNLLSNFYTVGKIVEIVFYFGKINKQKLKECFLYNEIALVK